MAWLGENLGTRLTGGGGGVSFRWNMRWGGGGFGVMDGWMDHTVNLDWNT